MISGKKIVNEVSGWLRILEDGTVDRSWTGPPELKFMVETVPPNESYVDGVATRDVNVDLDSGLSVRIYKPKIKPEDISTLPVILHFNGGGFCITQADWYMYCAFYSRLASTARAICISVMLRLAPEHRLPAAFDDAYNGLLWLRSVARGEANEPWLQHHADFGRVLLVGDSSGGNLVHMVAARAGNVDLNPVRLAGCVPLHPGFVRSSRSKSELEVENESPFLTLEMVDKFLSLGLPSGSTKDNPFTCPMGSDAPPLEGLNLPPFMVAVAQNDLMRDTQIEYYEAMKKAGKDVELFFTEGMGHCFYLNKFAVDMDPKTGPKLMLCLQLLRVSSTDTRAVFHMYFFRFCFVVVMYWLSYLSSKYCNFLYIFIIT